MQRLFFVFIAILTISGINSGQSLSKKTVFIDSAQTMKSTPAFAEVILRKTELESELESLLISYTEDFPKVKAIRFELEIL
ncbi:MAG: hypothetical protein JWN60_1005, partial [Acidobacteria bacterium]|nr:hypothetical protein [Acidobacteriota bacterium]